MIHVSDATYKVLKKTLSILLFKSIFFKQIDSHKNFRKCLKFTKFSSREKLVKESLVKWNHSLTVHMVKPYQSLKNSLRRKLCSRNVRSQNRKYNIGLIIFARTFCGKSALKLLILAFFINLLKVYIKIVDTSVFDQPTNLFILVKQFLYVLVLFRFKVHRCKHFCTSFPMV